MASILPGDPATVGVANKLSDQIVSSIYVYFAVVTGKHMLRKRYPSEAEAGLEMVRQVLVATWQWLKALPEAVPWDVNCDTPGRVAIYEERNHMLAWLSDMQSRTPLQVQFALPLLAGGHGIHTLAEGLNCVPVLCRTRGDYLQTMLQLLNIDGSGMPAATSLDSWKLPLDSYFVRATGETPGALRVAVSRFLKKLNRWSNHGNRPLA